MGKERPKNLVKLRITGPEEAVRQLQQQLVLALSPALENNPAKSKCRIGRTVRIDGTDLESRTPRATCFMKVPMETLTAIISK